MTPLLIALLRELLRSTINPGDGFVPEIYRVYVECQVILLFLKARCGPSPGQKALTEIRSTLHFLVPSIHGTGEGRSRARIMVDNLMPNLSTVLKSVVFKVKILLHPTLDPTALLFIQGPMTSFPRACRSPWPVE